MSWCFNRLVPLLQTMSWILKLVDMSEGSNHQFDGSESKSNSSKNIESETSCKTCWSPRPTVPWQRRSQHGMQWTRDAIIGSNDDFPMQPTMKQHEIKWRGESSCRFEVMGKLVQWIQWIAFRRKIKIKRKTTLTCTNLVPDPLTRANLRALCS